MLQNVVLPVAELARVKPTHCTVLLGLLAFADREGKCWPSLRKIAEVCGLGLSTVQRAITEMVRAGHLTRRKRFGRSCIYRIASRFLARWATGESRQRYTLPSTQPPPSTDSPDRGSPPCGTEGEARKKEHSDLDSKRDDPVRRAAPPPRAAGGPNSYAWHPWLRKLNSFISERLQGSVRLKAWEVIAAAEQGRESLSGEERHILDGLDRMMRAAEGRAPITRSRFEHGLFVNAPKTDQIPGCIDVPDRVSPGTLPPHANVSRGTT